MSPQRGTQVRRIDRKNSSWINKIKQTKIFKTSNSDIIKGSIYLLKLRCSDIDNLSCSFKEKHSIPFLSLVQIQITIFFNFCTTKKSRRNKKSLKSIKEYPDDYRPWKSARGTIRNEDYWNFLFTLIKIQVNIFLIIRCPIS